MMLKNFIKRNVLLYFRDKTSVFFSLLSTMIVLLMMIGFLGNANLQSTLDTFFVYTEEAKLNASCLISIWTISGIMVVNAVSIGMTLIGNMVRDEETKRMDGFLVSPVNRVFFVIGYILASIIVSFIMCLITFIIAQIYLLFIGGDLISLQYFIYMVIILISIIFSSSAFVFLCATCVHSMSAFSGLSTVMGTLIGFLAAIYMPYGEMPHMIQSIIKFVPAFHGASALRKLLMCENLNWFTSDISIKNGYSEYMGINIIINDHILHIKENIFYMIVTGLIFVVISTCIMNIRKRKER